VAILRRKGKMWPLSSSEGKFILIGTAMRLVRMCVLRSHFANHPTKSGNQPALHPMPRSAPALRSSPLASPPMASLPLPTAPHPHLVPRATSTTSSRRNRTGVPKLPRSLAPGPPVAKYPSPISPPQPIRSAVVIADRAPPYQSCRALLVRCIRNTTYLGRSSQLIRLLFMATEIRASALRLLHCQPLASSSIAPATSLLHADWVLVAAHLSYSEPIYQLISDIDVATVKSQGAMVVETWGDCRCGVCTA
jgi:hypothetical protein